MTLITYYPVTPSKRWQKNLVFSAPSLKLRLKFVSYKNAKKLTLSGHKNIHGLRFKHKILYHNYHETKLRFFNYVVTGEGFQKYPAKLFFYARSLFNIYKIFTNTYYTYPGFKIWNSTAVATKINILNQIISLSGVPLNNLISHVFNKTNKHMTFCKSSGTYAIRKKINKYTKLIYVELNSKQLKLLAANTYCFFAPCPNLQINSVVEGKWGNFTKNKKNIQVRGVAKNPVDHPNGGRTKAKQPELSPWGWIAKKTK